MNLGMSSDFLETLRDCQSPNRIARKKALKSIERVSDRPGYVEGLLMVLCGSDGVDENVQEFACSLLEKHIRSHYREYSQELKVEVKKDSLVAMGSRSQPIRQAVAGVIAALAQDPEGWPNLRPTLEASFESPDLNVIEGAMNTLARLVSEDAVSLLEWIAPLLPKITQFLQHPHPPLRAFAIECAQHLGTAGCRVVLDSIADIVQIVLDNMREGNEEVYTSVCQFLMFACTVDFGLLQPQLSAIIQFMIDKVLDDDKNLGTSAACCLVFLLERDQELETWLPHLPNLIPALLKGMVYEDKTVALLGGDREYENTVDKMDQMALAEPSNVESMDEEEEAVDYSYQTTLRVYSVHLLLHAHGKHIIHYLHLQSELHFYMCGCVPMCLCHSLCIVYVCHLFLTLLTTSTQKFTTVEPLNKGLFMDNKHSGHLFFVERFSSL
jgi:hypothetical protein